MTPWLVGLMAQGFWFGAPRGPLSRRVSVCRRAVHSRQARGLPTVLVSRGRPSRHNHRDALSVPARGEAPRTAGRRWLLLRNDPRRPGQETRQPTKPYRRTVAAAAAAAIWVPASAPVCRRHASGKHGPSHRLHLGWPLEALTGRGHRSHRACFLIRERPCLTALDRKRLWAVTGSYRLRLSKALF